MNVLVLGSGGREHALAHAISKSEKLRKLYIAPGNPGTAELGENMDLSLSDFESLAGILIEKNIELVVVGPEAPLVDGVTDYLSSRDELKHIMIIGPDSLGAKLEGSKDFAKDFMMRHKIPTAAYGSFTKETIQEAKAFLGNMKAPYVLKADGLAAGKGVLIIDDKEEAERELDAMLSGKFGKASEKVVIEEFLTGIELSVFVLTDGDSYVVLPEAKDYKRIGEGDTGLNTGGMGAVSPVPFAQGSFLQKVDEKVIQPTISGLKADGISYTGFIFIGLMNVGGEPYVIEYNVRMGDPESEVVLPRIKSDFFEMLEAAGRKKLHEYCIAVDLRTAVTLVLVSGGYPGSYEKGKAIEGLEKVEDSQVYHAGTILKEEELQSNGGRVMAITSFGNSMKEALEKSYANAEKIDFAGKNYRKDIGFDL